MTEPTILPLSQPIQAHGEALGVLTLRQPTGKDLRTAGLPYRLTAEGAMAIDAPAMHRMIATLANVPPSSIDQLTAADWNEAAFAVLGFITRDAAAPTTGPTPATPAG